MTELLVNLIREFGETGLKFVTVENLTTLTNFFSSLTDKFWLLFIIFNA